MGRFKGRLGGCPKCLTLPPTSRPAWTGGNTWLPSVSVVSPLPAFSPTMPWKQDKDPSGFESGGTWSWPVGIIHCLSFLKSLLVGEKGKKKKNLSDMSMEFIRRRSPGTGPAVQVILSLDFFFSLFSLPTPLPTCPDCVSPFVPNWRYLWKGSSFHKLSCVVANDGGKRDTTLKTQETATIWGCWQRHLGLPVG